MESLAICGWESAPWSPRLHHCEVTELAGFKIDADNPSIVISIPVWTENLEMIARILIQTNANSGCWLTRRVNHDPNLASFPLSGRCRHF